MNLLRSIMRHPIAVLISIGTGLAAQDYSQYILGLVGYGYTSPTPVIAAPGQLLTLVAAGGPGPCVSGPFSVRYCPDRAPGGADLPTTFEGISVGYFGSGPNSPDLPILGVT